MHKGLDMVKNWGNGLIYQELLFLVMKGLEEEEQLINHPDMSWHDKFNNLVPEDFLRKVVPSVFKSGRYRSSIHDTKYPILI